MLYTTYYDTESRALQTRHGKADVETCARACVFYVHTTITTKPNQTKQEGPMYYTVCMP